MKQRRPPDIEMTVDGQFVDPPRPPVVSQIMFWALIVALIAGAISVAAFALWLALTILPVALGAAVVAWGIYRFQLWRAQQSIGGQRNLWRP